MKREGKDRLDNLLEVLRMEEYPMRSFYSDREPAEGFSPKPMATPTRDREIEQKIDWQEVFGGWDASARKFFKPEELSFTVPYGMFQDMANRFEDSFLQTKTWGVARKKIKLSKKKWGEVEEKQG